MIVACQGSYKTVEALNEELDIIASRNTTRFVSIWDRGAHTEADRYRTSRI